MIGGQWLDIRGDAEREELHRLKTGALFSASVGCALAALGVPGAEQAPWRAFAAELGLLFQLVDDLIDGDGIVLDLGRRVHDARRTPRRSGRKRGSRDSTPTRACSGDRRQPCFENA